MRLEVWLLLITAFVLGNLYYEGRWLRQVSANQKYIKMAGVLFAAYSVYWIFRGGPGRRGAAAQAASAALRELDADAAQQLGPLLDRVAAAAAASGEASAIGAPPAVGASHRFVPAHPWQASGLRDAPALPGGTQRLHRRSVSEARRRHVAASQNWACAHCRSTLAASYEVDHIMRLDRGGSNEIDNLVALCRNCHGEKTRMEML
jgi:hypothetical protein